MTLVRGDPPQRPRVGYSPRGLRAEHRFAVHTVAVAVHQQAAELHERAATYFAIRAWENRNAHDRYAAAHAERTADHERDLAQRERLQADADREQAEDEARQIADDRSTRQAPPDL